MRVSATDGVFLLLREQLERSARAKRRDATPTGATRTGARNRIAALGAARTLSDDEFGQAAMRVLLDERLGSAVTAEPGFDLVVRDIARMIADAPEGQALLMAARQQLLGD